jgi:hypothetical protein
LEGQYVRGITRLWSGLRKGKTANLALIVALLTAIVAISSFGVILYECNTNGVLCLGGPATFPSEMLTVDHYSIQTGSNHQVPTILSLWLYNSGSSMATLESLSIRNSTGSLYYTTISASIAPVTMANVTVDTSSSALYFVTGQSYAVSVTTTRSNYVFSVSNA